MGQGDQGRKDPKSGVGLERTQQYPFDPKQSQQGPPSPTCSINRILSIISRVASENELPSIASFRGVAEQIAPGWSPQVRCADGSIPAGRLGPKRMAAFCAQHGYSGRRSPEELLQRLHEARAVPIGEMAMEAKVSGQASHIDADAPRRSASSGKFSPPLSSGAAATRRCGGSGARAAAPARPSGTPTVRVRTAWPTAPGS